MYESGGRPNFQQETKHFDVEVGTVMGFDQLRVCLDVCSMNCKFNYLAIFFILLKYRNITFV